MCTPVVVCQLITAWTKVHEIFNTHWGSDIPFRFGMPERRVRAVCHFFTKLVAYSSPAPSWTYRWSQPVKFLRPTVQILTSKTPGSLFRIAPYFYKMYRNDCRLTCWNQNYDIPIRFRTPVWQMNDDRLIPAELRLATHFQFLLA